MQLPFTYDDVLVHSVHLTVTFNDTSTQIESAELRTKNNEWTPHALRTQRLKYGKKRVFVCWEQSRAWWAADMKTNKQYNPQNFAHPNACHFLSELAAAANLWTCLLKNDVKRRRRSSDRVFMLSQAAVNYDWHPTPTTYLLSQIILHLFTYFTCLISSIYSFTHLRHSFVKRRNPLMLTWTGVACDFSSLPAK